MGTMSAEGEAIAWIVLALLAVLAELHSHTVYLLALAAALGLAGVLGLCGFGPGMQLAALGLVCLGGFPAAGWYRRHQGKRAGLAPADVGAEVVVVTAGAEKLRVYYRGTEWDAVYRGPAVQAGERLRIVGLRGSVLELAPRT